MLSQECLHDGQWMGGEGSHHSGQYIVVLSVRYRWRTYYYTAS